jgi:peptide/nickel transport system permease protein
MLRFAVRRLTRMAIVLLAISVATFLIFDVIPGGDPAQRMAGRSANEVLREQVREDYGFDEPVHVQYWEMMKSAASGDLVSYSDRRNVRDEIVEGIPATASLVIGAAVIWLALGGLLGVLSARYAGRWPDWTLTTLATVGISMPVFWLGLVALYYLSYEVALFPAGGYTALTDDALDWAWHLVLPWTVLSVLFVGFYSRLVRASVLDTEHEDYVRTARAKGLSERRVLVRHTLRNALIPVVTLFGLDFGAAFGGGAILTEAVFDLHGVGQYAADSVGSLDIPPVMGVVLYGAFFVVLLNALVDLAYAWLDPRVRA